MKLDNRISGPCSKHRGREDFKVDSDGNRYSAAQRQVYGASVSIFPTFRKQQQSVLLRADRWLCGNN